MNDFADRNGIKCAQDIDKTISEYQADNSPFAIVTGGELNNLFKGFDLGKGVEIP